MKLFKTVWQSKEVSTEWKNGMIVPLPKKGDLSNCNNWRGITLLSVPGKVFACVLLGRIQKAVDTNLRQGQAIFRQVDRAVIRYSRLGKLLKK